MFFESISLARFDEHSLAKLFELEGTEHLEAARRSGKGLLLSSGHFGAFDIATYGLGPQAGRVHILVRQQSNPWVDRDNARLRERTGHQLLPRRRAGHRMLNALRKGETVAFAIDQRVKPTEGVLIPFLGRPAWTGTVPAMLSTISGAPVVPITSTPLAGGRYRIVFEPAIHPPGRGEPVVVELTKLYTASIEKAIRRHPEQWFWMHERWLRSPRRRWQVSIDRLRQESQLPPREASPAAALRVTRSTLEEGRCLVLTGGSAEEQRRALGALGHDLVDRGHSVLFAEAAALARSVAAIDGAVETELRRLDAYDLLLLLKLDELGDEEAALILRLVTHRQGRRSTLACRRRKASDQLEIEDEPSLDTAFQGAVELRIGESTST